MNAIQEIKDESIRKVAQTLRASGLAASETEAVRMAMMMSKTSQRVTQNFDQKKSGATTGDSHLNESSSLFNTTHDNVAFSAQEKPRKNEEKEEFIFGDVQQQPPAQKKDPYKLDNEFEEIVAQDLVGTSPSHGKESKPVVSQKPAMFSGSRHINQAPVQTPVAKPYQCPRPVQVFAQSKLSVDQMQIKQPATIVQETPIVTQSTVSVSAAQSSQNAFSILLGSAQKNPHYEQEIKAHTPAPVQKSVEVKPVEVIAEAKPAIVMQTSVNSPRPIANSAMSPQKKMMMESNVDLSKMFNFNK